MALGVLALGRGGVQTPPRSQMSRISHEILEPVAVHLLAAAQACELRGGLPGRPAIEAVVRAIRGLSPALADDRPLDNDIEAVYQAVVAGALGQPVPAEG